MLEPKKIDIDGLKFQLQPIPPLEAIKLDKQVVSLIVPVIGGFKGLSLDSEIDLQKVANGLSEALGNMSGDEFQQLIINLFQSTTYLGEGQAPEEVNGVVINRIFRGKLNSIYKLAFEIMKYNKFSPFVLVEGGNVMNKILGSTEQEKQQKMNKNGSEKSGSLLET